MDGKRRFACMVFPPDGDSELLNREISKCRDILENRWPQFCQQYRNYYQRRIRESRWVEEVIELIESIRLDDTKQRLKENDKALLEHHKHFDILVAYYQFRYHQSHDNAKTRRWNAVKAGRFWRELDEPIVALSLTKHMESECDEPDLRSAIWTNRGACFHKLNQLYVAEGCALNAIVHNSKNYRPYFTLESICRKTGRDEQADEYCIQGKLLELEYLEAQQSRVQSKNYVELDEDDFDESDFWPT